MRAFTNHIVTGRGEEVSPPTEQELKGTSVLAMRLDEVSAKVRTGPPIDDEEDYSLPVWAGQVPVETHFGDPIPDGRVPDGVPPFSSGRLSRHRREE